MSEILIKNEKGQQLFARYWNEDDKPTESYKGLIFIVHGYCEHCLAYTELAEFLTGQGYYVFSHDHVGHGKSEGVRAHVLSFDDYVQDTLQHIDQVKNKFPDKPVFLIGHSMGGAISVLAAMTRPKFFAGVILIGPLITPDRKVAFHLSTFLVFWLCRFDKENSVTWLIKLFPNAGHHEVRGFEVVESEHILYRHWMRLMTSTKLAPSGIFRFPGTTIFMGKVVAKILPQMHIAKLDPKVVSRDEDYVKTYADDPLVYHNGIKCGWAVAMLDALRKIEDGLSGIEWPFFTLHGGEDALCDFEGSKQMYENARSTDKKLKIFEEAFHQLHHELEPVKKETFDLIVDWVNARV